jgi:DNA-binding ferritin-like protein (Dps family)
MNKKLIFGKREKVIELNKREWKEYENRVCEEHAKKYNVEVYPWKKCSI